VSHAEALKRAPPPTPLATITLLAPESLKNVMWEQIEKRARAKGMVTS
jgi:hypothetical protein